MQKGMKRVALGAMVALLQASTLLAADQTWSGGATGIWDNAATPNWDGGSTWQNGNNAIFGASGGDYVVVLGGGGVTVGNLAHAGTGKLTVQTTADFNQYEAVTVAPGGATWNTGGGEIAFKGDFDGDNANLAMTSGDTLTVAGGGIFNAGQAQNVNWNVAGATTIIQNATTVRGCTANIGQFAMIKLAGGSTFIMERNSSQTFANDWELGSGIVAFDNRFTRPYVLNGVVSGPGTLLVQNLGGTANDARLQLNATNTFTGGIIIDSTADLARLSVSADYQLGAVPPSFDPDNIVLRNGGMLKMTIVSLNPNRGITLEEGAGGVILNSGVSTINSPITGPGSFQVGWDGDTSGNVVILATNCTYTGATNPRRGTIQLGIENALPTTTLLTVGGSGGAGVLEMAGFSQTIGGLNTVGSNTRQIENNSTTPSTLTIDVAAGNTYDYGANFADVGDIALVKEGEGTQRLSRVGGYTKAPVSLTVNGGVLEQSGTAFPVPITVNAGGTLGGTGTTLANVVVNSGGSISPGNSGGWNAVKIEGDLDISGMVDDNAGGLKIGFGAAKDSIVVTNASGTATLNMDGPGNFDLGFSDFTFTHDPAYDLASGIYPLLVADNLQGTLDPTDLSGDVGAYGAKGELSLSNNTVYITVEGADTSPYGLWAKSYGLLDPNSDPDGDGYDNLQEFAYGGNPTNAAAIAYAPVAGTLDVGGTNWLTLVYGYRSGANPGVAYECMTVSELIYGTWTNAGISVLGTGTLDASFDVVTNAIPIDGTQDFLGVFIERLGN